MEMIAKDGMTIYVFAIAGPPNISIRKLDIENLPEGFRLVSKIEWENLQGKNKKGDENG